MFTIAWARKRTFALTLAMVCRTGLDMQDFQVRRSEMLESDSKAAGKGVERSLDFKFRDRAKASVVPNPWLAEKFSV